VGWREGSTGRASTSANPCSDSFGVHLPVHDQAGSAHAWVRSDRARPAPHPPSARSSLQRTDRRRWAGRHASWSCSRAAGATHRRHGQQGFEPTSGGPQEAACVGSPAVGDPGMDRRESPRALPPVGRALLLAAMRATRSAQPPERRPQWTRSRDLDHPPTMVQSGHQGFETYIRWIHHQQPAAMRCQSGLHVLGLEAGKAISVLDHNRGHGPVTKERQELAPPPVHSRPYLVATRPTIRPSSPPRPSLVPPVDRDHPAWSADDTRANTAVMPEGEVGAGRS
jgi:hypothetical protein